MTTHRGALPTLTEVIDIASDEPELGLGSATLAPESMPLEAQPAPSTGIGVALTTQVLETLRPRIDALLEARLQSVIAPQLARLADELVQSMRGELASTMRDLVSQAVADVLARRRKP